MALLSPGENLVSAFRLVAAATRPPLKSPAGPLEIDPAQADRRAALRRLAILLASPAGQDPCAAASAAATSAAVAAAAATAARHVALATPSPAPAPAPTVATVPPRVVSSMGGGSGRKDMGRVGSVDPPQVAAVVGRRQGPAAAAGDGGAVEVAAPEAAFKYAGGGTAEVAAPAAVPKYAGGGGRATEAAAPAAATKHVTAAGSGGGTAGASPARSATWQTWLVEHFAPLHP